MNETGRRLGLLTFIHPDRRLRSGDDRVVLQWESELANLLRQDGLRVVTGGVFDCEDDRAIHGSALGRKHVHPLVEAEPMVLLLETTGGAGADDVVSTVHYFLQRAAFHPELVLFADTERAPEALESWLAAAAALRAEGFPVTVLRGSIEDAALRGRIAEAARLGERRLGARTVADHATASARKLRGLVVGPPGRGEDVGWPPARSLARGLGVRLDGVRFDEAAARAADLARPDFDPRVTAALRALETHLAAAGPEDSASLREQIAWCFALEELAREHDAGFVAIQDGKPSEVWLAAAFLNQDRGFDGRAKDVLPTAPGGDVLGALSQALMVPLARQSTATARLVVLQERTLSLVGDLPFAPCFINDDYEIDVPKRRLVGKIDDGHPVTLAWLDVSRGRLSLDAIEAETADCPRDGSRVCLRLPDGGTELVARWRGSRGALAPGAHAAALLEMARELDAGWRIAPADGGLFER